jgi:dTMP kinase
VVAWAAGGVEPDLSVLVDVPPEVSRQRLGTVLPYPPGQPDPGSSGGGGHRPTQAAASDRLERLDADFHERVRHGFVAQARADGEHWVVVDGSGEVDAVAEEIARVVAERLGRPPRIETSPA